VTLLLVIAASYFLMALLNAFGIAFNVPRCSARWLLRMGLTWPRMLWTDAYYDEVYAEWKRTNE
jgi:hypothetical protein